MFRWKLRASLLFVAYLAVVLGIVAEVWRREESRRRRGLFQDLALRYTLELFKDQPAREADRVNRYSRLARGFHDAAAHPERPLGQELRRAMRDTERELAMVGVWRADDRSGPGSTEIDLRDGRRASLVAIVKPRNGEGPRVFVSWEVRGDELLVIDDLRGEVIGRWAIADLRRVR